MTLADAVRHRSLMAGLAITALLLLLIGAVLLLTSADPSLQDPMASFAPPSAEHPMGADAFGRDLFARALYGGRTTILASLGVVALGGLAGVTLGLIAGYAGGVIGFLIMRTVDLLLAFPASCSRWRCRPCSGRAWSTVSWRSPSCSRRSMRGWWHRGGMPALEAINAGTGLAAKVLGIADRVGTLQPGMTADVIAVAGDPLDDLSRLGDVRLVLQGGEARVHRAG